MTRGRHVPDKDPNKEDGFSSLAWGKFHIIESLLNHDPLPQDMLEEACKQAAELLARERKPSRRRQGSPSYRAPREKEKVAPQTIRNWIDAFQQDGMKGLERKTQHVKGHSRIEQTSPDLVRYIQDRAIDGQVSSIAALHREAEKRAEALGLSWRPSYTQVYHIYQSLPEDLKRIGREGMGAYRNEDELVLRFEAEYPNQIWQADHHLLDITVVDETGKPLGRPWMTAVMDDYSRAICGYYLSLDNPNSTSIALALRQGMWIKPQTLWIMHGIPDVFYTDNGRDFKSGHIGAVCARYKIEINRHEEYLPRAKGKIERFFRTLIQMLISGLDGYTGSDPKKRPKNYKPALTLDKLHEKIEKFIINTYHEREHGTTGQPPRERWTSSPRYIRPLGEGEQLDRFLKFVNRKVQSDGIRIDNRWYIDQERKLQSHIGKTITAFFHPREPGWIQVYDKDATEFICTAVVPALAPHNFDADTFFDRGREIRNELSSTVRRRQQRGRTEKQETERLHDQKKDAQDGDTASPPASARDKADTPAEPEKLNPADASAVAARRRRLRNIRRRREQEE
jgi:putative transposase